MRQKRVEIEITRQEPTLHLILRFENTIENREVFETASQITVEDC